jgi:hypothetical protein
MRRVFLLFVMAVVVATIAWHPARVAVQTLLLLPALFPAAPLDPLGLLTPTPAQGHRTYAYAGGAVEAQLFEPAGGGRHGAIILLLGAGDLPRSDLASHFAQTLARSGVVTLVPETSGMLQERLTFDEVDAVAQSVAQLRQLPSVDQSRIGVVGLSASGGLGIVAAGQPVLRDQIRFVNSFGSFDDAASLLLDVASRSIVVDGVQQPWQPEQRTVDVVGNALTDAGFSAAARAELLSGTSRSRAEELIGSAAPGALDGLAQVSPTTYLSEISAHLYLMHDLDDSFIPFTESRDLVARAPAGVVQRYTEFSIFAHVIPDRAVPWQTFLPDLWRLFWHVQAVLLEVL